MGTENDFQCKGEQIFLKNYLKPHTWTYLKERLVRSVNSRSQDSIFMISTAIRKTKTCIRLVNKWSQKHCKPKLVAFNFLNV